jgi:pantoate kinase
MATPEVKVKASIKKILQSYGVYYAMPIGTGYGNSGVPDFLCCVRGKFLAIEAKAGNNKPTALQEKHIRDIQLAGGISLVINESNLLLLEEIISGFSRTSEETKTVD